MVSGMERDAARSGLLSERSSWAQRWAWRRCWPVATIASVTVDEVFPAFALEISSGPLSLHGLRAEDISVVTDLAVAGIHSADFLPFLIPWTEGSPDEVRLGAARFYWECFASFTPQRWHLNLVARWHGEVVGMQDVFARTDFRKTRAVETGSWLGLAFQGRGVGTLMRQLVCTFCFDYLGAELMHSAYIEGNAQAAAVSRKVGYVDNGRYRLEDPKSSGYRWEQQLLLTPQALTRPAFAVQVRGLQPFLRQLGLDGPPKP
jgi:RimJ/RimL family protein N-acetyltransferase